MSEIISPTIVARFYAAAHDRLQRMAKAVAHLSIDQDAEELANLKRELHTLKGDAGLFGLADVVRLAHATEDLLLHLGPEPEATVAPRLYRLIDALALCMERHSKGEAVPKKEIEETLDSIGGEVARSAPATVAPSANASFASVSTMPARAEHAPRSAAAHEEEGSAALGRRASRAVHLPLEDLDLLANLANDVAVGVARHREIYAALGDVAATLRRIPRDVEALTKDKEAPEPARRPRSADTLDAALEAAAAVETILRDFRACDRDLDPTLTKLFAKLRSISIQPLRDAFSGYPALVRRTAREAGKEIHVDLLGEDIGVDLRVLEGIAEPMSHLLRNAIVHGIEPADEREQKGKPREGRLHVSAQRDGEFVRIDVADDGRGIDLERVRARAVAMGALSAEEEAKLTDDEAIDLVFIPGLSTSSEADKMAGRGVGLDAVRACLVRIGGSVRARTQRGRETCFTLYVPTTTALLRALLVEVSGKLFALPSSSVVELFRLSVQEIRPVDGREMAICRGRTLPLVRLREALGLTGIKDLFVNQLRVAVVRLEDELAGFVVDRVLGEREIVAQALPALLADQRLVSGMTVTEGGGWIPILYVPELFAVVRSRAPREKGMAASMPTPRADAKHRILLAEDSMITREYVASVLRGMGFLVDEAADGAEALLALRKERYDLLLSDLQMPNMDGFKLAASIRRDSDLKRTPIVIMSTLEGDEARRMALDAGADAFISKASYAPDVLLSTIRRLVG